MTGDAVVTTRGLTKRFGKVTAVEDLNLKDKGPDLCVPRAQRGGQDHAIRMLLGLVRPTAGEVRSRGVRSARSTAEWAGVDRLVETPPAYPKLTVRENLHVARRPLTGQRRRGGEVIERLHLGECADRRAGTLSLGNNQRLGLARPCVHAPELLVLDEPANALDPAGIVEIRELLRALADDHGTTVFVSTHILVEVAHLADRIGIVHDGHLVEELDRAALVAAARAFSAEQLTEQQRADALLTLELERYFLARTDGRLR